MNLDLSIFQSLYGFAHHWPLLDAVAIFFADYAQYLLAAALLLLFFYPKKDRLAKRPLIVLAVISALVARFVIKTIIIIFYFHPRPFVVLPGVHALISVPLAEYYQSFPSGHALFFFALGTALWFGNKKLGLVYTVIAFVMGIARIYVGVHWPSDIIGGAVIGFATSWLVWTLYRRQKNQLDRWLEKLLSRLGL